MYALKVKINDERPVVGGADDLCVLSAHVTCAGKLGSRTVPSREGESSDFSFRLGGLTSRGPGLKDEHLEWLSHWELKVGDKVAIEIVDVEKADPVISGKEAEQRANDEKEYFEHCKQVYFDLRGKYENES